jgi:hypothetical protein
VGAERGGDRDGLELVGFVEGDDADGAHFGGEGGLGGHFLLYVSRKFVWYDNSGGVFPL